jgi:hypothetical protein
VAGPDHATRCQLHDWIVDELRAREPHHKPIKKVRQLLENHKDDLLAFAERLDAELADLAERLQLSQELVREALAV